MQIINIATYKFVRLDGLPLLQARLKGTCDDLGLKGTILLGEEGINLILAGTRQAIDAFGDYLRADDRFSDIAFKESLSGAQPFKKMVVKIRKEIVTMGIDGISPIDERAPHITPTELKQWYDEGRDFTLLDTRNDFEVQLGTFDNAMHLDIECFRDFPDALAQLDESEKEKPVVIFCTGGIRCEKASPLMQQKGFKNVVQLDGGILNYFEECGGEHYHGTCFVFDERIVINPDLTPAT